MMPVVGAKLDWRWFAQWREHGRTCPGLIYLAIGMLTPRFAAYTLAAIAFRH